MKTNLLILSVALFLGYWGTAQITNDTVQVTEQPFKKVTMNSGTVYIGQILKDDGREILLQTKSVGQLYLNKQEITSIENWEERGISGSGNHREESAFKTRYYFTNNALPIKKGSHYSMIHLYGPEVHFAVSDRLSVGVMATWIASPIGLAVKYAIPTKNEKLNFSLGTILLSSGYLNRGRGYGGLHWGTITYGKPGRNISFSSGLGYINFGVDGIYTNQRYRRTNPGWISSIAGIIHITDKASFFFDSMFSLSERRNYLGYSSTYTDINGNPISVPTIYMSGTEFSMMLMPGMRFQKTSRRAFQVSLSGIVQYSSIGFSYGSSLSQKVRSFPVPMCSWFLKF